MNLVPRRRGRGLFDMTPMIDVVLQLIIFFMYTAQGVQAIRSPVNLPRERGDPANAARPAEVVIDVRADGSLLVERLASDLEGAARIMRAEIARAGSAESLRVLVRADRDAPCSVINQIADRLVQLGVRGWELGSAEAAGR